jgi:chromosome segregation ATPase
MSHADETSASQLSDGQAWDSMKSLLTDLLPVIDDLRFCIRGGEGGSDINAMENGLKKGLEICKDLAKLSSLSTALGNRQKKRLDELHGTEMCILTFQESQVGLKQTVSKLQDERDALSASIRNLEQQASSEEQKLQSLSSSLNRVRSENADLETRIASINNQQIRLSQVESALRVRENVVSEREEQAKTAGEKMVALKEELTKNFGCQRTTRPNAIEFEK